MIKSLISVFRVCSVCGTKAGQISNFCFTCRTANEKVALSGQWQFPQELRHLSLFASQDHHHKDLISLKDRPRPILTSWLIELLLRKRVQLQPDMPPNPIIVSAPSSTGRLHAHRLAKELSRQTGWRYRELFTKAAVLQKKKTKYERLKIEVQINGIDPADHYILIDDLLTTGATALACQKLLKKRKSFEVWTPYRTPLLRPEGPFAITRQDEKSMDCNTFNIFNGQW